MNIECQNFKEEFRNINYHPKEITCYSNCLKTLYSHTQETSKKNIASCSGKLMLLQTMVTTCAILHFFSCPESSRELRN